MNLLDKHMDRIFRTKVADMKVSRRAIRGFRQGELSGCVRYLAADREFLRRISATIAFLQSKEVEILTRERARESRFRSYLTSRRMKVGDLGE